MKQWTALNNYHEVTEYPLDEQQPQNGGIKPELQPPEPLCSSHSHEHGPDEPLPSSREERLALFRELFWRRGVLYHERITHREEALQGIEYDVEFYRKAENLDPELAERRDKRLEANLRDFLKENDRDKREDLLKLILRDPWFTGPYHFPRRLTPEQEIAVRQRVGALPEEELDEVIKREDAKLQAELERHLHPVLPRLAMH